MLVNQGSDIRLNDEFMDQNGVVLSPLYLFREPVQLLEASTKQYIDNKLQSLNANNLTDGIVSASRFPAFNGEISNSPGSSTLILSTTGVTLGDYAKVTVNAKGRISNGLNLTNEDIPNLDWSKITSDKPSGLDGYGITDGVKKSGGTLTGYLSTSLAPVNASDLINRAYLSNESTAVSYETGDVISKVSEITPTGFLACRGGKVSSTLYPELSNLLGDMYSTDTYVGAGRPWEQQYGINFEQNVRLSNWTTAGVLVGGSCEQVTFVTKNRVYVCGGSNGTSRVATCHFANINEDGTLSNWISASGLPGNVGYGSVVVTNKRVYIIGGHISTGNTVGTQVYGADINDDGSISNWYTAASLPVALSLISSVVIKDYIYLIAGYNGSAAVNTIYSNKINSDGTLNTWKTENPFPITNYAAQVAVIKNKIYSFGGYNNNGDLTHSYIYSATINYDGTLGNWVKQINLPNVMNVHKCYVINNRVFIIGGYNGSAPLSSVYWSDINEDGTLKGWVQDQSLPIAMYTTALAAVNNRLYIFGGITTSSALVSTIYTCEVQGGSNDYSSYYTPEIPTPNLYIGAGRPWEQQNLINMNETVTMTNWAHEADFPTINSRPIIVVTKNIVYVLGGHNGAETLTSIYKATIDSSGILGSWTLAGNLPLADSIGSCLIIRNKLYLFGNAGDGDALNQTAIYSANINSDGTLGTFIIKSQFPVALGVNTSFVTMNRVYIIVGVESKVISNKVYTAPIMPNGELGVWETSKTFPISAMNPQVAIINKYVYIFGGNTPTGRVNTIYRAVINKDGTIGNWMLYGTMPFTMAGSGIYVSNKFVFIIGGNINDLNTNVIYSAPILSNGDIGTFTNFSTIPLTTGAHFGSITTSSKLYIICGILLDWTCLSRVQSADISGGINDTTQYCLLEDTNNYLMPGSCRPWEQQYQVNLTQNANLTGWSLANNLPLGLIAGGVVVTKNRVYILSGYDGTTYYTNIYTTTINTDGSIGSWSVSGTLPVAMHNPTLFVVKNKVYAMPGLSGTTPVTSVYVAQINSDGTLGSFVLTNSTPTAMYSPNAFVTSSRVYLVGGYNGTSAVSTIYSADIYPDGTLGAWETIGNFSVPYYSATVAMTKNRVYLIGGLIAGVSTNKVFTAPISSDGILGNFTEIGTFPISVLGSAVYVTNTKVYILGGQAGSISAMNVYHANINPDGTLDAWVAGDNLPIGLAYHKTFATKNHLFVYGGFKTPGYSSAVYQVSIAEGLNDYSAYYDGTILPLSDMVDEYFFGLPDETILNDNYHTDLHYYIKF